MWAFLFYQYLIGGNLRLWQNALGNILSAMRSILPAILFNPVKHGYVGQISDWRFSTFYRYVKQGIYPHNWGGGNADFSIEYD
ncbi:hypothetical protein NEIPOLOT_01482 [Neisseria polysaccharea ATCC 43768]|nr:hypothetical protein NEIPOLOT_01482 [Neisseria polysaccharea ATCC 43768]